MSVKEKSEKSIKEEKPEKDAQQQEEIPQEAWDNFDKGLRKVFKPRKD